MSVEEQLKERNRRKNSENVGQKAMFKERSDEIHGEIPPAPGTENRSITENSVSDKRFLVLVIHFCNLLYATSYWINVGVFPVRNYQRCFQGSNEE